MTWPSIRLLFLYGVNNQDATCSLNLAAKNESSQDAKPKKKTKTKKPPPKKGTPAKLFCGS